MTGVQTCALPISNLANGEISRLKRLLPYRVILTRDPGEKEKIHIEQIIDNQENDVTETNIRLSVQSLGPTDCYWLDSGIFDL